MAAVRAFITLWLVLLAVRAADAAGGQLGQITAPEPTPLAFGSQTTGTVNATTPHIAYAFDGVRGDLIAIGITFSGSATPLLLLAPDGAIPIDLEPLDAAPGRDLRVPALVLPETGRYRLAVARFGGSLGVGEASFTLELSRLGASSQGGSVLRYGDSVYNALDAATPQVFYSFVAARGDVVTVRMQRASGDLDAALKLADSTGQVIAENDDDGASTDAAIRGLTLREGGEYAIIASRYGGAAGTSRGSFVLTLSADGVTALGGTIEFALPLAPGATAEGTLGDGRSLDYYRFEAPAGALVSLAMRRASGDLDPLLFLADANGRELATDDDGGGGQNAAIVDFVVPATGVYLIGATRFERASGATRGGYTLTLAVRR